MSSDRHELHVLALIAGGLIIIILAIVLGLFIDDNGLPNWAENVLVSVATAAALKLGDCIAALISLASGRQVQRLGDQLAASGPAGGAQEVKVVNRASDPVPTTEEPIAHGAHE